MDNCERVWLPVKVRETDDPIVVVNSRPPESCTTQVPLKIIRGSWVVTVTFCVKTKIGRKVKRRTRSNITMTVYNSCSDYCKENFPAGRARNNFTIPRFSRIGRNG